MEGMKVADRTKVIANDNDNCAAIGDGEDAMDINRWDCSQIRHVFVVKCLRLCRFK
jgi:hypothetical protein